LRDTDAKIIDVAVDFVFGSHEGFTRAFSRQFGMTPQHFRKHGSSIKFLTPEQVRPYRLISQKGASTMPEEWSKFIQVIHRAVFVHVIDRPARKLILKRGVKATHYYEYCDEVGCDVWKVLCGIKEALYEPIGMWMPDNLRPPRTSLYAHGVEVPVDYAGEVPEGFDIIDLPVCKIMVFQEPPTEGEPSWDLIGNALETYDPTIYGFEWADEDAPRFQLCWEGYQGWIGGRPVRELKVKSQKEKRQKPLLVGSVRGKG
jgi:hypothetical protein